MSNIVLWMILVILFAIAELISSQLISIWFAGGALAAFIVSLFGTDLWVQFLIFTAVSAILLLATKPFVKAVRAKKFTPTNYDKCIGQTGVVITDIDNVTNSGRVYVDGLDWAAKSIDGSKIEKDSKVIIKEVQGVKLIVELQKDVNSKSEQKVFQKI